LKVTNQKRFTFTGKQMMQSRRSATARLARKILVGLFISRKPNTAHRIIALPNTPNNKVRLKTKQNYIFDVSIPNSICL
jgi:hypothetical protein